MVKTSIKNEPTITLELSVAAAKALYIAINTHWGDDNGVKPGGDEWSNDDLAQDVENSLSDALDELGEN